MLRKATLKYPHADFDESLYEPDRKLGTHTIEKLQSCNWIDEPKNLLITGSAGAGKTHIANALCITALQQLRTVKYIRANTLLQQSEKARYLWFTVYCTVIVPLPTVMVIGDGVVNEKNISELTGTGSSVNLFGFISFRTDSLVFNYLHLHHLTSFDYWGRDEDTKEVILSPGIYHKFEGTITVEVKRECALFIDFESDKSFKEAKVIDGKLKETESKNLDFGAPGEFYDDI